MVGITKECSDSVGSTNRLADAVLLAQACQVYGLHQSNEELLSLSIRSGFFGIEPRCISLACQSKTSPFLAKNFSISNSPLSKMSSNMGVKKRSEYLGHNGSRLSDSSNRAKVLSCVIIGRTCDPRTYSNGPESSWISSSATQIAK